MTLWISGDEKATFLINAKNKNHLMINNDYGE